MNKNRRASIALIGLLTLLFSNASQSALLSRLGGQAYYHEELGISWLANASLGGFVDWNTANAWAAGLTVAGVGGWRLPDHDVDDDGIIVDCSNPAETACSDNEMGYLYYRQNVRWNDPLPFLGIQNEDYWGIEAFDDPNPSSPSSHWVFNLGQDGSQNQNSDGFRNWAWAVHDGDVGALSAIPLPAAGWLFATALIGLAGFGGRRPVSRSR